jgi:hypothetical protein
MTVKFSEIKDKNTAKDLIEKALNGLEDNERIQYYYPYSDISDEINFEKLQTIIDKYVTTRC